MKTLLLTAFCTVISGALYAQTSTLTLNERGTFSVSPQTTILVDGVVQPELPASIIGTGYKTRVQLDSAPLPGFAGGAAAVVAFDNTVKGPISGLAPLKVLEQPVVIDGDTLLIGVPADLSTLTLGALLEVSGFTNADGAIQATRVRLRDSLEDWKLEGAITQLAPPELSIGAQRVRIAGVNPACALALGQTVSIDALPVPGYAAGIPIDTTTSIECVDELPLLPGGAAAQIEGFVRSEVANSEFVVGDQRVRILSTTDFERGTIDDLLPGVRVEVVGSIEAGTQVLLAAEIDFERVQFRFEAPVQPADVTAGLSITMYRNTALFSTLTRDEDGIAAAGLSQPLQVEVRGTIDRTGVLNVTRIRERGNPDPSELELRGPVAAIQSPDFTILGVRVRTAGAVYFDLDGTPLTASAFFALLQDGVDVAIENGAYNASLNEMTGGLIRIEWRPNAAPAAKAIIGTGAPIAAGLGTATAVRGDRIFSSGF